MTVQHKVRVWFGHTAIATHVAEPAAAARYAAAMDRRFPGLPITNEPIPATTQPRPAALVWAVAGGGEGGRS